MFVIEIAEGIEQRLLVICLLHKIQEIEQRIAEDIRRQPSRRFDVDHWNEVLLTRQTLRHEVLQLFLLIGQRTIEVVASHFQSILMSQLDVPFESGIDTVATLRSLQVDVGHLRIVAHSFPKHLTLIVAEVDTVDVRAGVFAHHIAHHRHADFQAVLCSHLTSKKE